MFTSERVLQVSDTCDFYLVLNYLLSLVFHLEFLRDKLDDLNIAIATETWLTDEVP